MNTNLTYNNNTFPVRLNTFGTAGQPDIPPAGEHPVAAAQGKWTSFVSPQPFAIGSKVCFDSGFTDKPYCVRVEMCIPTAEGHYVAGTIGG